MREFHRLNCLTRREHGLPPQPVRFFENLRAHVLEKGLGSLLLARHKEKAIAGAVFLHLAGKRSTSTAPRTGAYQELRANNLVFREAIRHLCGKGVRTLSFGRTDLHHEGLRQFKLSWGTTRNETLQYVKYDVTSKSYLGGTTIRPSIPWENTMSKLPVPRPADHRKRRLPARRVGFQQHETNGNVAEDLLQDQAAHPAPAADSPCGVFALA